jgi:DNA-binding protein H-NS
MGEKQYSQRQVANTSGKNPKSFFNEDDFASMSVDELWDVYQKAETILAKKIASELDELKRRLTQLDAEVRSGPRINRKNLKRHSKGHWKRRPYPKVLPKYQNPAQPSETWSGRGKVPRWLAAQLSSGKKIEYFRIE